MSKGSKPRPFSVSNEDYANRWDAIFGRDQPKEKWGTSSVGKPEYKEDQQRKTSELNELLEEKK